MINQYQLILSNKSNAHEITEYLILKTIKLHHIISLKKGMNDL